MTIQSFSQAGVQVSHQDQKPAPGSLGSTGNLRFKPKQGGTPRISRFGVLRARIENLLARLKIAVSWVSKEIRAQRKAVIQSRANSLRIASLLGALTAQANDSKAQRGIARELVQICKRIGKDKHAAGEGLSVLLGRGGKALSAHLSALNDVDLHALRLGVLGQPGIREKVLAQVESFGKQGEFKDQAEAILSEIKGIVDQQLAVNVVHGPLAELDRALSPVSVDGTTQPVDGQELADKLIKLSGALAMVDASNKLFRLSSNEGVMEKCETPEQNPQGQSMLEVYLGSLSRDRALELFAAFRADKLVEADQALSQGVGETEKKQALAMLESLRTALGREMQARANWEEIAARVDLARSGDDRNLAIRVLCDTDALLAETEQVYGWVPKDMNEYARNVIGHAQEVLRDVKNNPNGPLNEASLRRLDPASLEKLRQAARLHDLGLQLDASADAAQRRVLALGWQTVQGMNDVFQAMTGDSVDVRALVLKLRELSRVEALRIQELNALGLNGPGMEELGDLAEQAVDELRRAATPEQWRAMQSGMFELKRQEEEFARVEQALGEVVEYARVEQPLDKSVSVDDYKVGGQQIMAQIGTTRRLLSSMSGALEEAFRPQRMGGLSSRPRPLAVSALPDAFYQALQTQYEVAYDPRKGTVAVLLTDSVRAQTVPQLEETPDVKEHLPKTLNLSVNGVQQAYTASHQFIADTLSRPCATFSVRGAGANGQLLSFTWPSFAEMDKETRSRVLEEAVDALGQVAGPAFEALSRIMNQQIYAGLLNGVTNLGPGGPYRLDSGSALRPYGGQNLHCDVVRDDDGSFTIGFRARISLVHGGDVLEGGDVPRYALLNKEVSWAEVEFTLKASPDGLRFDMVGLPQFRHHLDVVGFV